MKTQRDLFIEISKDLSNHEGYISKLHSERVAYYDQLAASAKVTIEVSGGVAECTSCPEGVEVEIIDHDDLEAEDAMRCKTCLTNADSLLGGECPVCRQKTEEAK